MTILLAKYNEPVKAAMGNNEIDFVKIIYI
jgi:hypothetical protein